MHKKDKGIKMRNENKFTGSFEIYRAFAYIPNKFDKLAKHISDFQTNILESNLIAAVRITTEKDEFEFCITEEYAKELLEKEAPIYTDIVDSVNKELGNVVQMKMPFPVCLEDPKPNDLPESELGIIINEEGGMHIKSQERNSFEEVCGVEIVREDLNNREYSDNFVKYRYRCILKPFCVEFEDESIAYVFPIMDLFTNGMGILRCSIPMNNQSLSYIEENNQLGMIIKTYVREELKNEEEGELEVIEVISKYLEKVHIITKCNILVDEALTNIIISKSDYEIGTFDKMSFEIKKDLLRLIYAPYKHEVAIEDDTKLFFDTNVFGKDYVWILTSSTGHCITLCEEDRNFLVIEEEMAEEEIIKHRTCSGAHYAEQAIYICLLNKINSRKTYMLLRNNDKTTGVLRLFRDDEDYITELYEGTYGSAIELIQFLQDRMNFFLRKDIYQNKILNCEKNITQEKEEQIKRFAWSFNFIAMIFTVLFGLPVIKETIDLVANLGQAEKEERVSIAIWGLLILGFLYVLLKPAIMKLFGWINFRLESIMRKLHLK